MKRILALSLSAALLFLLCACGSAADPETTVIPPDPTQSAQPSESPLPDPSMGPVESDEPSEEPTPSAEPSEEPAPTPSSTPTPTSAPTAAPTTAPTATPTPTAPPIVTGPGGGSTQEPTAEPSKAPDGFANPTGPSASDVNLTNFYQTVLNSYGFPPMEVLPSEFAANYYPGLFTIPVVQRVVGAPAMTGVAAELTLVQVSNSSDVNAVKAILQARVDRQVAGGAFYPLVVEAWQNNSRVVSSGNYVMLIVHDQCDAIVAQFNALF